MDDEFLTVDGTVEAEAKVQSSRFIARVLPVETKQAVDHALASIRKEFHGATHHCYAYRLGPNGDQFRCNDDGEPSGTAGKPILAAIDEARLTNILVVVIRYFGGTKLGTGGLVRAYAEVVQMALGRARIVTRYDVECFTVIFPHDMTGRVMHAVSRFTAHIDETQYDDEVQLSLRVRRSKALELKQELMTATSGNVRLE